MIKKIITLCGLMLTLMLTVQITTQKNLFAPEIKAQNYTSETGPTTFYTCPLCYCQINQNGDCCCGGVDAYAPLLCFCNICLGSYVCSEGCPCQSGGTNNTGYTGGTYNGGSGGGSSGGSGYFDTPEWGSMTLEEFMDYLYNFFNPWNQPTTVPVQDPVPTTLSTIIFCNKVTIPFLEACQSVANNIGIDVNYLMAAMAFETGETFSPTIENPSSCAVGLIQFTSIVCGELGTTMVDLRGMSNIEQLAVVEDYFQLQESRRGDIQSLEDVYMAILCPAAIGKSNDYVLYSSPSTAYTQNSGLDANGDRQITKAEASQMVWNKYNRGLNYTCN